MTYKDFLQLKVGDFTKHMGFVEGFYVRDERFFTKSLNFISKIIFEKQSRPDPSSPVSCQGGTSVMAGVIINGKRIHYSYLD